MKQLKMEINTEYRIETEINTEYRNDSVKVSN